MAKGSGLLAAALLVAACGGSETPAGGGEELAANLGCLSCHMETSTDLAPTWHGLAGSTVELADGSSVVADEEYLRRSITDPDAQVVAGYGPVMPVFDLTDGEVDLLVQHIQSLDQ